MLRYYQHKNQSKIVVEENYDRFQGKLIVVDLAAINGKTEVFEGQSWLQQCLREQQPLGWSVLWKLDREEWEDYPVAVMQFASSDTALLLRTHHTGNWLPAVVEKILKEPSFKKICVGFELGLMQKMESTFNFIPEGMIDLERIAGKKGVSGKLKSIADHFGLKVRKDAHVRRSNWYTQDDLTREQIQYAVDEAYYARELHDRLDELPDKKEENEGDDDVLNQGILTVKPEWEGMIVRNSDGLYCQLCEKGPMNVPMVVEAHIGGKKHKERLDALNGVTTKEVSHLSEEYIQKGIMEGDGLNGLAAGLFKCLLCSQGPFENLATVESHVNSKKHIAKMAAGEKQANASKQPAEPEDKFADKLWNLPDYVTQTDQTLTCNLCGTQPFSQLQTAYCHLGGKSHASKCRLAKYEEIMYVKDRERLEYIMTGKVVIRTGFTRPNASKPRKSRDVEQPSVICPPCEPATADSGLPEGWEAYMDPSTNRIYYWHEATEEISWERPRKQEQQKPARDSLPKGWAEYTDPSNGKTYYYHEDSKRSQWERPVEALSQKENLPPGWIKVWSDQNGQYYYADLQDETSQFEPPPPYTQQNWERTHDPQGKPFWICKEDNLTFYENDTSCGWARMQDGEGRNFWSNSQTGRRFFEPSDCH